MSRHHYVTTAEDRQHFCSYDQAIAAIPDALPFKSNGEQHIAVNVTTGHKIPCADAFMASGYVAGSSILFPHWVYVIEMGNERVKSFDAHPRFVERLNNVNWNLKEDLERNNDLEKQMLLMRAQNAYDNVIENGIDVITEV